MPIGDYSRSRASAAGYFDAILRTLAGKNLLMTWNLIVFYLLLIDAVGANILAWFGSDWYVHHFRLMSRWFPASRGWATYYLILVLFIGYLVTR